MHDDTVQAEMSDCGFCGSADGSMPSLLRDLGPLTHLCRIETQSGCYLESGPCLIKPIVHHFSTCRGTIWPCTSSLRTCMSWHAKSACALGHTAVDLPCDLLLRAYMQLPVWHTS